MGQDKSFFWNRGSTKSWIIATIGFDEAEQIAVRFLFACLIVLYTSLVVHSSDFQVGDWSVSLSQAISIGYMFTVLCCSVGIFFFRSYRIVSRVSMILVDLTFLSIAMALVPQNAIPLCFVYLWVIFGNGFRYGNRYLFAATGISLVGFGGALVFSDFWAEHRPFGIGILFSIVLLSSYVSLFIRRLNTAKYKLEQAVIKADEANAAKSNFLANMSHELRTPLNGVITVSDLLLETPLSKVQQEYANTIHSSASTLLGLINDVLDFSKIESGRVTLDHICFDLYACINDVLNIIRPLAEHKGLSLHNNISNNTPRFIYGDPMRLKQVLINLTNNAVKFTERGHISLHTYPTELGEEHVHLSFEVIDTGIGISEDAQDRVFERFMQEDETITRRYGGTGLGISIAQQLVELMGGVIGVSSTIGKGSRFWFEIDASVASSQDFEYMTADVLIVSNNEKRIHTWKKLLTSWEMNYVIRKDFQSALDMLQKWEEGDKKRTILLDEDTLKMAPVRAAQMIKDIGISKTSLFLSTMNPMPGKNPDIQMYFDALLDIPIDSRQLYHTLMGETTLPEYQDGVISLSSHIERKSEEVTTCSLNILVAEDQATNQFVFRRILEMDGHNITVVDNGQEALDILGIEQFDLTLIDLHMPEVSGLEVIKMFRYMSPDSDMPFVMITANTTKEVLDECRSHADLVLIKPVVKRHLLDMVHKVVSSKTSIFDSNSDAEKQFRDVPLLDEESLNDMLGDSGNIEFLTELFHLFSADSKALITKIKSTIYNKKELPLAKDYSHALKGIANNIAARRLAAHAKYCEYMILTDSDIAENAEQVVIHLEQCFVATKKRMQAYVSEKNSQRIDL